MEPYRHPILASIPAEERRNVTLSGLLYRDEQQVLAAGQAMESVLFVMDGTLRQVHRDPARGVKVLVDSVSPGEMLGGDAGDQAPVSRYQVLAAAGTAVATMPFPTFQTLVLRYGAFARTVMAHHAAKARLIEERALAQKEFDLSRVYFDPAVIAAVPGPYILQKRILPLAMSAGILTAACAADDLAGVEQDLRKMLGVHTVVLQRISQRQFEKAYMDSVQTHARTLPATDDAPWFQAVRGREYALQFDNVTDQRPAEEKKETEIDGRVVVALVNRILGEALDLSASDIHFEPYQGGLDVRYRLDGELLLRPEKVPPAHLAAVTSRLKILAGLDIAERRKPQDGRITVHVARKSVDMRVSTVPTRFGEKVVLRILDPSTILMDLESLVISKEVLDALRWMVEQPSGMIYIAGPTGSGKTTTVYSMLLKKKAEPLNLVTIEDPIEYSIKGITQVQRNIYVGLDFPHAIRAFLRQDPDVIIVGETRDPETAKAALEAGLTGHLVISTIHSNNVFATAYRLREMGLEPFVIANSLIGVASQRLVRRVCPHCSQTVQYHRNLVDPLGLSGLTAPSGDHYLFQRGKGCVHCNGRGYKGRAAIFETLRITDVLKPALASDVPFVELEKAARTAGAYISMREHAGLLLATGVTTPEEISRVLFVEER